MSSKYTSPRRRKTLAYPSPPSSIGSVSSCSSFSSTESTESSPPGSPAFTSEFSFEPQSVTVTDYSFPPRTAHFFSQRVHRVPPRMTKREEWTIWYSANFGSTLLEPWEKILLHLLFLAIMVLTYVALSRLFIVSPQLVARLRFYATGGGSVAVVNKALASSL